MTFCSGMHATAGTRFTPTCRTNPIEFKKHRPAEKIAMKLSFELHTLMWAHGLPKFIALKVSHPSHRECFPLILLSSLWNPSHPSISPFCRTLSTPLSLLSVEPFQHHPLSIVEIFPPLPQICFSPLHSVLFQVNCGANRTRGRPERQIDLH